MSTLDWIKNKEYASFTEDKLLFIRDFTLVWNIFETKLDTPLDHGILINRMNELEKKECFELIQFKYLIDYFTERYISGENRVFNCSQLILYRKKEGDSDQKFEEENTKKREGVLAKLKIDNPYVISESLLPIILRVRNNLFHGNKSIHSMEQQQELFEQIIEFLKLLIDTIDSPKVN